jgi:hypothetical protein
MSTFMESPRPFPWQELSTATRYEAGDADNPWIDPVATAKDWPQLLSNAYTTLSSPRAGGGAFKALAGETGRSMPRATSTPITLTSNRPSVRVSRDVRSLVFSSYVGRAQD